MIPISGGFAGIVSLNVLTQEKWFIDPANATGLASNNNDGYTSLTPLLDENELTRRRMQAAMVTNCCGYFPILQNTVVTYLSAPNNPYADTASLRLDIDRVSSFNLAYVYAPTVAHSGTITAITPRAATQWWQVTGGFGSSDVGGLVVDTTRGTTAWILAQTSGVADTSEWVTKATGPADTVTFPPAIAPVVGDMYAVQSLARIHIGHINIRATSSAAGALRVMAVSFYNFTFASDPSGFAIPDEMQINAQNGAQGAGVSWCGIMFTECAFEGKINITNALIWFNNCRAADYVVALTGQVIVVAGVQASVSGNASYVTVDGYAVFTGSSAISDSDFPASSLFELGCILLYNTVDAFMAGVTRSRFVILPSVYNGGVPEIVGRTSGCFFRVSNGGLVLLHNSSGTWTAACKASSAHFAAIDGAVIGAYTAVSFNQATLALGSTPIVVTQAALDLAIGSGGFGGWAVHPGTGTSFRHFNE